MPTCPAGHDSSASDYCDVCGLSMDALAVVAQSAPATASPAPAPAPAQPAAPCPRCGAPGLGQFCEVCGYSTKSPPGPGDAPPESAWTAVITASRACYETVLAGGLDASDVPFPDDYPERRIPLTGSQLRIGRRSISREVRPEIDLTGPPADPCISRLHAVLVAQPDGSWAVIEPGSENGISVNGADVAVGDVVPLRNGDCISVGAWTAITIVAG